MSQLQNFEEFVRKRIVDGGVSHKELSEELKQLHRFSDSTATGSSVRSIQRFCHEKGIHKVSHLSQTQLEQVVMAGVGMVSTQYARV